MEVFTDESPEVLGGGCPRAKGVELYKIAALQREIEMIFGFIACPVRVTGRLGAPTAWNGLIRRLLILRLRKLGYGATTIALSTGVSARTVRRITAIHQRGAE